ncbi:hypothetical protein DQ04_03861010 [Trypanosoma grayi]|uniref:hypothetical protein n=1 Tax=Trypanosoma grayi TaxID=71804 RepID=UPI0004F42DF7|nr:hypothetical protein DQ04_03861010 [Trypanosoma grayi]KEG10335.1 hypothetical protein DQ04_03861010 [Trypanosoma grayi]
MGICVCVVDVVVVKRCNGFAWATACENASSSASRAQRIEVSCGLAKEVILSLSKEGDVSFSTFFPPFHLQSLITSFFFPRSFSWRPRPATSTRRRQHTQLAAAVARSSFRQRGVVGLSLFHPPPHRCGTAGAAKEAQLGATGSDERDYAFCGFLHSCC